MDTQLSYNQILELLPAYAIGALEPDEMLAVDAYLEQQRTLLAKLHEAELATVQLAYAAPEARLPAQPKARLLAQVQLNLKPQGAVPSPAPLRPVSQSSAPAYPGGWLATLRALLNSKWAVATGVAILVLLVAGLYLTQIQNRLTATVAQLDLTQRDLAQLQLDKTNLQQSNQTWQQQLQVSQDQLEQATSEIEAFQTKLAELQSSNIQIQGQLAQATSEIEVLQTRLVQLQSTNAEIQKLNVNLQQQWQANQDMLALLAAADPQQVVQLPGTAELPQASGTFYLSQSNRAVLVLRGLRPLPATQTYQFWFIPAEGPPIAAGLLVVQGGASTWLTVNVPAQLKEIAAVGVSIEPAGGSEAPTKVVLLGTAS